MRCIRLFVPSAILTFVTLTRVCDGNSVTNDCVCVTTAIVCFNTNITSFGPEDQCNKNMTDIFLDGNQIDLLQANAFSGLTHLKRLVITRNNLIAFSEGIFNESCNLEFITITKNPLRNLMSGLFSGLKKLKEIDLSENKLEYIPVGLLSGLPSLELLDLSRNELTSLPQLVFSGLKNLKKLDLSDNRLSLLPIRIFIYLTSLKSLFLSYNRLIAFKGSDLNGMVSLEDLRVDNNRLKVLPPYDDHWPSTNGTFYYFGNNITSVTENVLRSWLKSGDEYRSLILSTRTTLPLRDVSSLRSLLRDRTLEPFVIDSCRCGGIKKGNAEIRFCVDVSCGESNKSRNWFVAIRKRTLTGH